MSESIEAGALSQFLKNTFGALWKNLLKSDKVNTQTQYEVITDDQTGVELGYISSLKLKNGHTVKTKVLSNNSKNKSNYYIKRGCHINIKLR